MPTNLERPNDNVAIANNALSLIDFLETPLVFEQGNVVVDYYACQDMPEHLKQWAFDLVKDNMYDMYARSKDGWDDEHKKSEMFAPEARYLVARSAKEPMDLKGFLLFRMLHEETMDDDVMAQAAYCFELQLIPDARGLGIGEYLMNLLERIGKHWRMDKMMLTVFKANKGAFRFYTEKMGFELDEISPSACLSHLQARKFDYEILSKALL
ncbi:hypothetical protein O0I10_000010 [Lichtheimia ornata]|uniref:N-alpha-acetyltransferase 40 n=1 Tax=Lichtheimia ornata TaxID=688661 RepID=A0AAD8DJL5_9FUNG|nr:uncharacterized protein O0I10_000010 [Lichtheimia ornata]KAJ8663737.1 hypothetical protein O0I10_000010 [Lichtheimia ornata]